MSRFAPSRLYLTAAAVALGLTSFSAWFTLRWWPAGIATALFVCTSALILWLATRPAIEIRDKALAIGRREIPWTSIRRVDQTGWVAPLVLYLTMEGGERMRVLYPGDAEASNGLMSLIQRKSCRALINGIEWVRIFGEPEQERQERVEEAAPRMKVLTESDEAEVERLYQQLRTAGRFNDQDK
ncbi:MAG: hypothetical protein C0504_16700 [Candidatus Solibacter sp.]|nr:hypothetical protein [Candidatus Solibacter sp.]